MKDDIRRRREARIKELTLRDIPGHNMSGATKESVSPSVITQPSYYHYSHPAQDKGALAAEYNERDPEQVWRDAKQAWGGRYGWKESERTHGSSTFMRTFFIQFGCTIVLCVAVTGLMKWKTPFLDSTRNYVASAMSENMDFQSIAVWAEATFGGSPAFIPIWKDHTPAAKEAQAKLGFQIPMAGNVVQPFALSLQGIELRAEEGGANVASVAVGRVIRVIEDPQAGSSIVIQHANQYMSYYERLEECYVKKDDWVEAGQEIGRMPNMSSSGTISGLFFALKKEGQFVDPAEVMSFD
ncbi:M23 family metallopeptidase [Paenibacillus arenosi]|uniref:M23 family metallopeptidase n=1 Tax=Paenibacillus arenosi TaxID=2774142 RepID=A0ABR9B336_9BACL|nr:M23 family metallopeptidase [Paenibacillus arenosi]MBD8500778.1 M23 family metallopeptidase [Paenibacillus arenosi]